MFCLLTMVYFVVAKLGMATEMNGMLTYDDYGTDDNEYYYNNDAYIQNYHKNSYNDDYTDEYLDDDYYLSENNDDEDLGAVLRQIAQNTAEVNRFISSLGLDRAAQGFVAETNKNGGIPKGAKNWMKYLSDSNKLNWLNMPGTHDTMAMYDIGGMKIRGQVKCQDDNLFEQLNRGIRFLDVRLKVRDDKQTLEAHHGPIYMKRNFAWIQKILILFLYLNPTETIIMNVQCEHTPSNICSSDFKRLFDGYLNRRIGNSNQLFKDKYYTNTVIPTLGQVRGKIVLWNSCWPGYGPKYPCGVAAIGQSGNIAYQALWQHGAKGNQITDFFNSVGRNWNRKQWYFINWISASRGNPYVLAQGNNHAVWNYIGNRVRNWDRLPTIHLGIVAMDFPPQDLIQRIIRTNGGYWSTHRL